MPSTVADIFGAAGLSPAGAVPWGSPVSVRASGVYVVALTDDAASFAAALPEASPRPEALGRLLEVRPGLLLDGVRPDVKALAQRIARFWLSEVVLYIGRATRLRARVQQYYRTPLGANRPHAGGWWLKVLPLDELWVHWAPASGFADAETEMLRSFATRVSPSSRQALHDVSSVMPFANLEGWDGRRKAHGIRGATGSLPSATREGARG